MGKEAKTKPMASHVGIKFTPSLKNTISCEKKRSRMGLEPATVPGTCSGGDADNSAEMLSCAAPFR